MSTIFIWPPASAWSQTHILNLSLTISPLAAAASLSCRTVSFHREEILSAFFPAIVSVSPHSCLQRKFPPLPLPPPPQLYACDLSILGLSLIPSPPDIFWPATQRTHKSLSRRFHLDASKLVHPHEGQRRRGGMCAHARDSTRHSGPVETLEYEYFFTRARE